MIRIGVCEIAYAESVPLDWNGGELAEGLSCYRRTEFFLAHEHWEIIWLTLEEPEKSFLQALIQTSAAFHHLQAGNSAGAISLLRRALRRFELCPERFAGISIDGLRLGVREWLEAMESGTVPVPPGFPSISPSNPENEINRER
jgi:predicted metal-dependent hydrolase